MKFSFKAQNPLEWIALKLKLLPEPLAHSHLYYIISKAILEASKAGIFDELDNGPLTIEELAKRKALHPVALRSLITCIAASGYLDYDGSKVSLTKMAKKWMVKSSKTNLQDQLALNLITWEWMDHVGDFLKTGKGIHYHDTFKPEEWDVYQRAMAAGVGINAREFAKKCPMPAEATEMLDVGGSHGTFSVELCKRFPKLKATVFDLPQAVDKAAPLLAAQGMGERVKHVAGNALTDSFGENKYDFVLCGNLMHHFSAEENNQLTAKIAKALKPGGYFGILEFIRPQIGRKSDQIGATLDLFFALSSTSGTWSIDEMKGWQTAAGLKHFKVIKYLTLPGFGLILAKK